MPRKNPPDFNFDWEFKKFESSPKSDIVPCAKQFENFEKLSPNQVLAFTWGFQKSSADYYNQLGDFMKDLDLHPADDSLLGRVLRMSFQLWYYKAILKKYPRVSSRSFLMSEDSSFTRNYRIAGPTSHAAP
uniref:Uncharacterized protein n=1 Tax=Schistocephalus solidus TaxID=70667 RepID=A0A0X3PZ14_SCHSO